MLPAILHNIIGTLYWLFERNSIILTALENKCPLNSFSFLDFRMTKSTKPKIDKLNIKIMHHCILPVCSIIGIKLILSCLSTTPTSFIYYKARLVECILITEHWFENRQAFIHYCWLLQVWGQPNIAATYKSNYMCACPLWKAVLGQGY